MRQIFFFLLFVLNIPYTINVSGCTNILVSKGASSDSSTHISYAADSHDLYGELYLRPAASFPDGAMMDIIEWDSPYKYLGKIRQAKQTYSVVGNINEHQLVIGETTYGGREELVDSTAVLDYGNLIYITLQRAKTARAAIDTIAYLLNEYGYYSEGESFSIADPNEVWIMELIGKGSPQYIKNKKGEFVKTKYNKGAVWVAQKVPDGFICAHANHTRISQFPLHDPNNCKYSKDVISFARESGWFSGEDKDFSFSDTYAPLDYEAIRFCEARVYNIFRRAAPSLNISSDYILGIKDAKPYPLFIKPDKKLGVKDVISLMRDHFEGTEFDMTKDIGGGPYQCPYRWRPLTWKVDSITYLNERAISTQQTGFSFVSQSRSWLPDYVGGILWFGVDDTYSTVYIPMYCSMQSVAQCFTEKNGDLYSYSPTSAFWAFNWVSNFSYLRYNEMIVDIQQYQSELENGFFASQDEIEKQALKIEKENNKDIAIKFLNDYSIKQSDTTFYIWTKLGHELLVKYMDGNVKTKDKKVLHPPYPEWWYKLIIRETGDKLKMK
jgi:dipeptidase